MPPDYRHNTFGDTAMTHTHAQLQAIVDELGGRQKTGRGRAERRAREHRYRARAHSKAVRFGGDRRVIDDAKQQYALVADEYNALVSQINASRLAASTATRERVHSVLLLRQAVFVTTA
jgi:hypothetical protein